MSVRQENKLMFSLVAKNYFIFHANTLGEYWLDEPLHDTAFNTVFLVAMAVAVSFATV